MKKYFGLVFVFVLSVFTFISLPKQVSAGWTELISSGSRVWCAVASSIDGVKLAATDCNQNSGGYIYTSIDSGDTWVQKTSDATRGWQSITSSSNGTKLAAVVRNGYIYTSIDSGDTWVQKTSDATRNWYSITSSSDGTKLAAVVYGGYIYTSIDSGDTWVQKTSDTTRNWKSITSSSDGTKLAAVVEITSYPTGGYIYTSTNSGDTWTEQTNSGLHRWYSIASSEDGNKLIAVDSNSGYIYISTNSGTTWTTQTSPGQHGWYSVSSSSSGTNLAAVGYDTGDPGYINYLSIDGGNTWIQQNDAGFKKWYSVAFSADGTKLIAGTNGSYLYRYSLNITPFTPSTLAPTSKVDGSTSNLSTPTLTFSLSDPDVTDTLKYKIQIDDTADFSSPVVDYTSVLEAQGARTFTVGQAVGTGTYTVGSESQILTDSSYYWRVLATDAGLLSSAYTIANSGAVAFNVDTIIPTLTLLGSSTINTYQATIYTDAGATATDNIDGNITNNIVVVNNVDTNTVGTYTITYNVDDAAGNHATELTRTVNVNKRPSGSTIRPKLITSPTITPPITPPTLNTTNITNTTNTTTTKPTFTKNILPNTRNNEVKQLQQLLKDLGYFTYTPTGYYGSITKLAVKKFQKDHNIKQTGNVGPQTRKALGGK